MTNAPARRSLKVYPLRENCGLPKSPESPGPDAKTPTYEELYPVEPAPDDPSREDRDLGLERE